MKTSKKLELKKFIRVKENFTCGKCGKRVKGSGYTNHCPRCLWSKHVDQNPGDRAALCGGYMQPVLTRVRRDGYDILQRCEKCGLEKWNKAAPDDLFELILKLSVNKKLLA